MSSDSDQDGTGDTPAREDGDHRPQLDIDSAFAAIVAEWASEPEDGQGRWPAQEDLDEPPDGPQAESPADRDGTSDPTDPGGTGSAGEGRSATGMPPPGTRAEVPDETGPEQDTHPRPAHRADGPRRRTDRLPWGSDYTRHGEDPQAPRAGEPLLPPLPGARDDAGDSDADEGRFVPPDPPPLPRGDVVTRLAWIAVLAGPLFLLFAAVAWRTAPQLLVLSAVGAFVAGFVALVARMPRDRGDDDDDGAVV